MAEHGDGAFRTGERLTADKLNNLAAGRPLTVTGAGHTDRGSGGDVVAIDQAEVIYIRLTGKDTTKTPIRYAWKEVARKGAISAATDPLWIDVPSRIGTLTSDAATEINNTNLSTTDNYVYRAERSPNTGEWLFFLRRRTLGNTANITYTHPQASAVGNGRGVQNEFDSYYKDWNYNFNGTSCTYNTTQTESGTYESLTYWYEPTGGSRQVLATFNNDHAGANLTSPLGVNRILPPTVTGTLGADIVFNDNEIAGTTLITFQNAGVNSVDYYLTHSPCSPANATVSVSITPDTVSPVSLVLPITVTPAALPPPIINYPASVVISASLTPQSSGPQPLAIAAAFAQGWTVPATVTQTSKYRGLQIVYQGTATVANYPETFNLIRSVWIAEYTTSPQTSGMNGVVAYGSDTKPQTGRLTVGTAGTIAPVDLICPVVDTIDTSYTVNLVGMGQILRVGGYVFNVNSVSCT